MSSGERGPSALAGAARTSVSSSNLSPNGTSAPTARARFWTLTLGSVGVVYGDIGTSPLYAFREALYAVGPAHAGVQRADVIGVLSLILWALTIVVTLKYVLVLLRADNEGEGGTLSLMALARRAGGKIPAVFTLGVAGAALFYGDAIITPAISVLSAVEGLKLVTPGSAPYVLPLTIGIIVGLFLAQSRGTAQVAAYFGPLTALWFVVMTVGGLLHIADDPAVFHAVNPVHAVVFLANNGMIGLVAFGAVFLAVTGAEALYADLGHFGRRPIQTAWLGLVFPSLAVNYLGQGALVLRDPAALENPFFFLFPSWSLVPVVILATIATVIASQAVITGAYSLTRQAIQLNLLPRLEIRHTSEEQEGQIYMPQVNLLLMIGVVFLVVLFGSSSRLATAYGLAVTGTMVVTACLAFIVVWKHWGWPVWGATLMMLPFFAIDLVFLGANMLKVAEGGYVPLLFSAALMLTMATWVRGTEIIFAKSRRTDLALGDLIHSLERKPRQRVPGTAVFLTANPEKAPAALLHSLKHYRVLHEKNVILTLVTANVPRVADGDRVRIETLGDDFVRVVVTFGYSEEPNVPRALAVCRRHGLTFDIMSTSFFLSRRSVRVDAAGGMPRWQDKLFILMVNNASDATEYFRIPTDRVVEIGTQVTI
jgi:KUP system potassium uptake protein